MNRSFRFDLVDWFLWGAFWLFTLAFLPIVVFRHPGNRISWVFSIILFSVIVGLPILAGVIAAIAGGDIIAAGIITFLLGIVTGYLLLWVISAAEAILRQRRGVPWDGTGQPV